MVFWIAILVGGLFVWLAVRRGFYETWILLFNVLVSIYVAIFAAPLVADFAPTSGQAAPYGMALSAIVLAGACFALLQGFSFVVLTGQFSIPFPRFFDIIFSGLFGFAAGFLILSFAALVVTTTPLAQYKIVQTLGFNEESQRPNIACVARCCNLLHSVARFEDDSPTAREALDRFLARRNAGPAAADPNAPADPNVSATPAAQDSEQVPPGQPPQLGNDAQDSQLAPDDDLA